MSIYLHEEIIEILTVFNREMTVNEIYKNIKNYRRRDGKLPPLYQVGAHVYDYPKYFYINRNVKPYTVGLIEWKKY